MPDPSPAPTFRAGAYVTEDDLAALAREAIRRRGLSLTAAAGELGKSVTSVSDAVNQPDRPMGTLRREIIARFAGYGVAGPFFRLSKLDTPPDAGADTPGE